MGWVLGVRGDKERALAHARTALALHPTRVDYRIEVGSQLLCLGSSLPHVSSPAALTGALSDFAAVLRPGGLAFIQNRNFDLVLKERRRLMPPQSHREGRSEWLFIRFYDFNPDGSISFNVATLYRDDDQPWQQRVSATRLWPLRQADLMTALQEAGFEQVTCYGSMEGTPFVPDTSPNLVISARKR